MPAAGGWLRSLRRALWRSGLMGKTNSVPPCGNDCLSPSWHHESLQWCGFEVQSPFTDWGSINARANARMGPKADSDRLVSTALEGISVYVVEEEKDVQPCLGVLYDSMRDPIIGIDTEWRPDSRQEDNAVAMIQLASSSCVLLIRTCMLGGIPQPVIDFCKDDEIVGVGFHWDRSDELKMLDSFDIGRRDLFSHFVDVRIQAEKMGYCDMGVNSLAKLVLGFEPPHSKHVTMSNWESSHLDHRQIRYAAMDAVVTGDTFRALRQLHANPTPCQGCSLPLGYWPGDLDLHCYDPECKNKRPHSSAVGLLAHMKQKGHASNIQKCAVCKRVSSVPEEEAIANAYQAGSREPQGRRPSRPLEDSLEFLNLHYEGAGSRNGDGGAVPLEEQHEGRGEGVSWSVSGAGPYQPPMSHSYAGGAQGQQQHRGTGRGKGGRNRKSGKRAEHKMYTAYNHFS